MENRQLLFKVQSNIQALIRIEEAFREGKLVIENETLDLPVDFKNVLKAKFVAIRAEVIADLNSITGG